MSICNSCTFFAGDNVDHIIRFITGHHPECPDFSIDKETFQDEFNRQVSTELEKKLIVQSEIIKKEIEEAYSPKELKLSNQIIKQLYFILMTNYFPICKNSYIYNWESDLLAISKDKKYITEYEIKISRNDFKADFKKEEKHKLISDGYLYKCNYNQIPNYFYYVTPPGLLDVSEIPEYAGLIEIGTGRKTVKRAPLLHKEIDEDLVDKLLIKIYYKYWLINEK